MAKQENNRFMLAAIEAAAGNIKSGLGGPFGAVVVRNGQIVAVAGNRVTSTNDPTAHAEVVAIREACNQLGTFDLTGCEIYASCEPCPMCLGAILWARLDKLFFAADRHDAAKAGFDDAVFYQEIAPDNGHRILKPEQMMQTEARKIFVQWNELQDKIPY